MAAEIQLIRRPEAFISQIFRLPTDRWYVNTGYPTGSPSVSKDKIIAGESIPPAG
jgi:hypothetical protein